MGEKRGARSADWRRLAVAACVVIGLADGAAALEKGSVHKGKPLFRSDCRPCHMEGQGMAKLGGQLHPDRLTQEQWARFFEEKRHVRYDELWGGLSERDLGDVFAYVHAHAYDSPSPAKCK